MKKELLLVLLIFSLLGCKKQDTFVTNLKLFSGDKLCVDIIENTRVYLKNNVIQEDSNLSSYVIEVLEVEDNGYLINWLPQNNMKLEYSIKFPIFILINSIVNSLEYKIYIDKCGKIINVLNWEDVKIQYDISFESLINNPKIFEQKRNKYIEIYGNQYDTKEEIESLVREKLDIIFCKFCEEISLKQKNTINNCSSTFRETINDSVRIIKEPISYSDGKLKVRYESYYKENYLLENGIDYEKLVLLYEFDAKEGWLNSIYLENRIKSADHQILHTEKYRFYER